MNRYRVQGQRQMWKDAQIVNFPQKQMRVPWLREKGLEVQWVFENTFLKVTYIHQNTGLAAVTKAQIYKMEMYCSLMKESQCVVTGNKHIGKTGSYHLTVLPSCYVTLMFYTVQDGLSPSPCFNQQIQRETAGGGYLITHKSLLLILHWQKPSCMTTPSHVGSGEKSSLTGHLCK